MMIQSILIILTFASPLLCLDVFKQSECGHTKSCLRWSSCNLPYCDFGFSWKAIEFNSLDYLELEIVGHLANSTNGFVALGFSTSDKMIGSGVVACRMNNGEMKISCGHNGDKGHSNELYSNGQVDSNFLVTSYGTRYGIEFDSSFKTLRCRFLRLITPNKMGIELKNLGNDSKYYLLSAKGITNSDERLSYHRNDRRASSISYNMTSSKWVNNIMTDRYVLVKIHACFMIIGWIVFATNGIFIAYFFKNSWPESSICGQKVWFQFHRILQTSCIVCVVVGFVVIFVNVGRYSSLGSLPDTAHPVLGIIATSLLMVNPIIALFRCGPQASSRWIFNGLHFVVGISSYLCALSAMAIGIQLPPAGPYLSKMIAPYAVVITFLVTISIYFTVTALLNLYFNKTYISPLNEYEDVNLNETHSVNSVTFMSKILANNNRILFISVTLSVSFAMVLVVFVLLC